MSSRTSVRRARASVLSVLSVLLSAAMAACGGGEGGTGAPAGSGDLLGGARAPGPEAVRLITSSNDSLGIVGAGLGEGLIETPAELKVALSSRDRVRYCVDRDDPYVSRLTLRDAGGRLAWEHVGRLPCPAAARFADGTYTLTVYFYGAALPGRTSPVFVHSPADARRTLSAPAPDERWTLRFAATGRVLRVEPPGVGTGAATVGTVVPGDVGALDAGTLLRPVQRVADGYEQMRLFSEDDVVAPTRRSMLNWTTGSGDVQMSPVLDPLPVDGGNAVGAYLRPLGPYRFAYCFHTAGFTRHHCLGQARDGRVGVYRTFAGTASETSLRSADPNFADDAGLLVANPRYVTGAAGIALRRGEAWLAYAAPDASSAQGGLIYGEDASLVPPGWTPAELRLGPDTEVSLDGGTTWIDTPGPLRWSAGQAVRDVRVRRNAWDLLVSGRSCRGCDLSAYDLTELNLAGVDLGGAFLGGRALNFTNLSGARLQGAEMSETTLHETRLAGADLTGARLRGASIDRSDFQGARLAGVDLTGAQVTDTDLSSTAGGRTVLDGAVLDGVTFRNAAFVDTPLACVSLRHAQSKQTGLDLRGASLQCVDLSAANLQGSRFDAELRLPGGGRLLPGGEPYPLPPAAGVRQLCTAATTAGATPDGDGFFAAIPCRSVSLRGAVVDRFSPPVVSWRHADMSYATIRTADGRPPALSNFDFSGGRFSGVDFSGARLLGANFEGATLRGARFVDADLTGARLSRADLSCDTRDNTVPCEAGRTRLDAARLRGAVLSYANARGASFAGAVMNAVGGDAVPGDLSQFAANLSYLYGPDTDFTSVDLTGVNLSNAQVYGARTRFVGSVMVDTNLSGAILSGVDFSYAQLLGTNFANANLVNARFVAASLGPSGRTKTAFSGAFLQGADLSQANAFYTDFIGATVASADGSMRVQREISPGQMGVAVVGYKATRLPDATNETTDCPGGSRGPCSGDAWRARNPKEPACVPAPNEFCPVQQP